MLFVVVVVVVVLVYITTLGKIFFIDNYLFNSTICIYVLLNSGKRR